jgi:hypothetical protein
MAATTMPDLLDETLAAHGGLDRWRAVTNVRTSLSATGAVWAIKGQPTLFADVTVDVNPHAQHVSATPFVHEGWRGTFEPDRVRIDNANGEVEEERADPRAAFAGHTTETPWDHLHAIYFGGYALWTYVTLPFVLTEPGFVVEEIEPWRENGEHWRRLSVRFPENIATHSKQQVLYIGDDGLIRRHDYSAEIVGGGPGAHYLSGHKEFDGIVFPTTRRVFPRRPDNTPAEEPLLIAMDFANYTLS